jgi:hypothetical protein
MAAETTESTRELPERLAARGRRDRSQAKRHIGKADWSSWPIYDGADAGLRNY